MYIRIAKLEVDKSRDLKEGLVKDLEKAGYLVVESEQGFDIGFYDIAIVKKGDDYQKVISCEEES